ncbi:31759_t:CDS:2, partial [Racocetra persica]
LSALDIHEEIGSEEENKDREIDKFIIKALHYSLELSNNNENSNNKD